MPAKKPATTPIPVQLSETEFTEFILPHLSISKRGPKCKLGYHRVFNLILWVLYTGMQWKYLPIPKGHFKIRQNLILQRDIAVRCRKEVMQNRGFVVEYGDPEQFL